MRAIPEHVASLTDDSENDSVREYNGSIMTSHNPQSPSVSEICASVKRLGYAATASVRLYGEDFEVLSDPFLEAGGVAVQAMAKKDSRVCILLLPATVLQSVRGQTTNAA